MTGGGESRTGRQGWHGLKRYVKAFLALRLPHAAMRRAVRTFPRLRSPRLPAPRALKEVRGVADDVRFVMVRPDRCEIAKELYWGDGRRPRPEDDLAIRLFLGLARASDVMLDVGAYSGIFTLVGALSHDDARVHAFEIIPEAYKLLFDNCVRNDVLSRVTLHHEGIGRPDRMGRFPLGAGGSAIPSFLSSRDVFETGVRVRFRALDETASWFSPSDRVVMKIDVEGTEAEVFEFGQAFLATHRPDILCEVLAGIADVAALERLLAPHGYAYYLVGDRALVVHDRLVPNARFRDWLFTTRSPDEVGLLVPMQPSA